MTTTSKITEAMLRDWQLRGLTIREAASAVGLTVPTVMAQEESFGIRLKRDRQQVGRKKAAIVAAADNTSVKAWSCRPAAIQRALEQRGMQ